MACSGPMKLAALN